ncbi:MAG: NAD(P)-dependent oxidoreductase [Myxococcota bacterium]
MGVRAGFVGVGRIGRPMAQRAIDAGLEVAVCDARAEAVAPLVAAGARAFGTPAEVAAVSDVVCVVVLDDAQTRDVVAGARGLLAGASPGDVVCICSTVSEPTVLELAERAREAGIELLDAGVAGGSPSAETGTLVTMVGGEAAAVERARPVLMTFSKELLHAGGAGAGMRLKLVKNLVSYLALGASHEGRLLAEACGFDAGLVARVVDSTSLLDQFFRFGLERPRAQRWPADAAGPELEHAVAYTGIARKDLAAALALARDVGAELPLAERAREAAGSLFLLPRERETPTSEDR